MRKKKIWVFGVPKVGYSNPMYEKVKIDFEQKQVYFEAPTSSDEAYGFVLAQMKNILGYRSRYLVAYRLRQQDEKIKSKKLDRYSKNNYYYRVLSGQMTDELNLFDRQAPYLFYLSQKDHATLLHNLSIDIGWLLAKAKYQGYMYPDLENFPYAEKNNLRPQKSNVSIDLSFPSQYRGDDESYMMLCCDLDGKLLPNDKINRYQVAETDFPEFDFEDVSGQHFGKQVNFADFMKKKVVQFDGKMTSDWENMGLVCGYMRHKVSGKKVYLVLKIVKVPHSVRFLDLELCKGLTVQEAYRAHLFVLCSEDLNIALNNETLGGCEVFWTSFEKNVPLAAEFRDKSSHCLVPMQPVRADGSILGTNDYLYAFMMCDENGYLLSVKNLDDFAIVDVKDLLSSKR